MWVHPLAHAGDIPHFPLIAVCLLRLCIAGSRGCQAQSVSIRAAPLHRLHACQVNVAVEAAKQSWVQLVDLGLQVLWRSA